MNFDPDHALAVLLQAQFNEEMKKKKETNKENLPVAVNKSLTKASLVDPEWETTDPCPDIHGLFMSFNDRFFWGRLQTVVVKWSPQMTMCAGICVYEGRNGMCSVRLSAPLLKLRPRSDLVETLLHEMIHAYLFVTNNNRDRDGHGPEFHKHMNRINQEAGTNITVYHSFHAEVKLYQQHWWRCNGPCQYKSPFFGMVKRARNRAPSANDLWWADHQASCGGQFIKVREPEDYGKKKKKTSKGEQSKDGKDIRNFFKKPNMTNGFASVKPDTSTKVGSNVFGFNNLRNGNSSETIVKPPQKESPVNRVVGFKDLSSVPGSSGASSRATPVMGKGHVLGKGSGSDSKKPNNTGRSNVGRGRDGMLGNSSGRPSMGRGRGGMLANRGGGTLVVTGSQGRNEPKDPPLSPNSKLRINTFQVFSGSGFTLGGSDSTIDRSRSRLLSIGQEPECKKQKVDNSSKENSSKDPDNDSNIKTGDEMCKCFACDKHVLREEMDVHLETCSGLQNIFNDSTVCNDVEDDQEVNAINKQHEATACPVCSSHIEGDINAHIDECLNNSNIFNVSDDDIFDISDSESPFQGRQVPKPRVENDSDVEIIEPEDRVACPLCGMRFGKSRINDHVNQCLDSE